MTGCLAAAARPSRVERLVLLNATAAGFDPRGRGEMTDEEYEDLLAFVRRTAANWGEGLDGDRWLPGVPDADAAGAGCNAHALRGRSPAATCRRWSRD